MTLIPYMVAFIAGAIGWAAGRRFGIFPALMLSMLGSTLGFYYSRRYVKNLKDTLGS